MHLITVFQAVSIARLDSIAQILFPRQFLAILALTPFQVKQFAQIVLVEHIKII